MDLYTVTAMFNYCHVACQIQNMQLYTFIRHTLTTLHAAPICAVLAGVKSLMFKKITHETLDFQTI